MADREPHHIELTLRDAGELFDAPAPDPFNGRFEVASGVDRLLAALRPSASGGPLRVTINLPPDRLSAGLDGRCRSALRGYCAARIGEIDTEKARVKRLGLQELRFGLLFLAACLLVAGWVELVDWTPDFLQQFFGEGLVIIWWIALWHPVDMLLFERWPLDRDRRIYGRIRDAEITVRPVASSPPPTPLPTGLVRQPDRTPLADR